MGTPPSLDRSTLRKLGPSWTEASDPWMTIMIRALKLLNLITHPRSFPDEAHQRLNFKPVDRYLICNM